MAKDQTQKMLKKKKGINDIKTEDLKPTDMIVKETGRRIYKSFAGKHSEIGRSIPIGNKVYNIPSIQNGKVLSEDKLADGIESGKLKPTSVHNSMEEAIQASKNRSDSLTSERMDGLDKPAMQEGGLLQEGGTVDPVSGNDVPVGSTQEEVRDDIPAQLSEGEFVFPADVVRFIGLNNLMKLRQEAKEGLGKMDRMGQMGNSEEATEDDTGEFDSDIDSIIEEVETEMAEQESPKDTIEEPEDTIEKPEDSDLKKKIEEGVTGFNVGGSVEKEDDNIGQFGAKISPEYQKIQDEREANKVGNVTTQDTTPLTGTTDPTINEELPPTEKPKTVNEQVRDYRSPFAMKRLDPSKGMPDTESSQVARSLLGKKGFTSARDIVSKKFPGIVDPTKDPNTSTKVGTSTTNKTQQTKVEKDFSTFISGPEDYTNLTGDDAKSNIMNQLQHQNEYLNRQGQSYPNKTDVPFINQYMADSLAQAGIKDLRQLGYKDIEQPKASVNLIRKGNKYYYDSAGGTSSNLYKSDKEKQATLIEVPASEVKKVEGKSLGYGVKNTKFTAMIEQPPKRMLINKDTGEEVVQGKYGGELNKQQDTTRAIGYGMRSEKEPIKNLEQWKSMNDPKKGVRWGNTTQTEGMTNFMIRFDENDNALIYPNYVDTKNDAAEKFAIAVAIGAGLTYGPGLMSKVSSKISSTVGESTVKSLAKKFLPEFTKESIAKEVVKKGAKSIIEKQYPGAGKTK